LLCLKACISCRNETRYGRPREMVGVSRRFDATYRTLRRMDEREPLEPSLEGTKSDPQDEVNPPAGAERLPDGNFVGTDNIRDGKVGGVIGGVHQQGGEGQGG
jgi:hypothetical protein